MKKIAIQLFLFLCGLPLFSQYDRVDTLLFEVFGNSKSLSNLYGQSQAGSYLYSGIICDSRTLSAGRELGNKMYTINGSLYWLHSGGFYLGASGSWYSELDPGYNSTVVTAGIRKSLGRKKNLSLGVSYSRYFFNVSDSTEIVFNNNVGTGLTLRNSWIGCHLWFNALFGKEFGMNLSPDIFANITLARFGSSGRLFLAPEISLFLGSETIEYQSEGSIVDPGNSGIYTSDKYGLLNTQASMQVCVYAGNFDVELGYSWNFPTTQVQSMSYPMTSYFSFSVGYLLPLR
jgi:hypothetical protein